MSVNPPRPKAPHLNAMRAFEAAARLGGFSAAAEELSVTPGAVSQQIRALEDWAGAELFERRSQGVGLTDLGREVSEDFTSAFDALGTALHRLRAQAGRPEIRIAALPAIAQLWLAPRLPMIRKAVSGVTISVTALEAMPNLRRDIFDLAIFLDTPSGRREETVLCADSLLPACSPEIAARVADAGNFDTETLLVDTVWNSDWQIWADGTGYQIAKGQKTASLSLYSMAVEEACAGAGVLMGHRSLISKELSSGKLVTPLAEEVATERALVLTRHPGDPSRTLRQVMALLTS